MNLRTIFLVVSILFLAGCYVGMDEPVSADSSEIQSSNDDQFPDNVVSYADTAPLEGEDASDVTASGSCSDPFAHSTCYSQANCRRNCGGGPGFLCVPSTNCCYCE